MAGGIQTPRPFAGVRTDKRQAANKLDEKQKAMMLQIIPLGPIAPLRVLLAEPAK